MPFFGMVSKIHRWMLAIKRSCSNRLMSEYMSTLENMWYTISSCDVEWVQRKTLDFWVCCIGCVLNCWSPVKVSSDFRLLYFFVALNWFRRFYEKKVRLWIQLKQSTRIKIEVFFPGMLRNRLKRKNLKSNILYLHFVLVKLLEL